MQFLKNEEELCLPESEDERSRTFQTQGAECHGKRRTETYREQWEQHPGGDHDLTLPRLHLILRTSCSCSSLWFLFLPLDSRERDTAPSQVTAFQVKWQWACILSLWARTWWTLPQEADTLQREPARLLQFKGTVWNHVRALKGKWNKSRVCLFFAQLVMIRLHFIRSVMIQQMLAVVWIQM